MTLARDSVRDAPADGDRVMAALCAAVQRAKGPDPLLPVTVVAPSAYAALFARRALGATPGTGGRRGVANVSCTTVDKLVRQLGVPALAARGRRLAPDPVDLEAIRTGALASSRWLADLVGHPRGLVAVRNAVTELRRCPAPTLVALARRRGRIGDLARLVEGVRAQLHARGFADAVDLAEAAVGATQSTGTLGTLGPVLLLDPGAMAPAQRRLLDLVGAHTATSHVGAGAGQRMLTEVMACADPDEEVRAAVRTVLRAIDAGVPAWAQAIFHPPGPGYARLLHQELAAAGVAGNGPETRRLDRCVAGTMLLGLLELAGSDWGRHEVMAWLSTAPIVSGPDRRPVPASQWDLVSSQSGVVRGAEQWGERLRNRGDRHAEQAHEAGVLATFVEDLVIRAVPRQGSWSTHALWAVELLDLYLDADPRSCPAREVAAAEQVRGTVLALGELDKVSDRPDYEAFQRAVRTALEETRLDTSELPDGGFGDGVFVASFAGARGLQFERVVLVGMADAVVPGGIGDDALLPESVRRLDISGGLRTRDIRLQELHDDVHSAIGSGATRRVAAYPPRGPPDRKGPGAVAVDGLAHHHRHQVALRRLLRCRRLRCQSTALGARARASRPGALGRGGW